jgi:hypothetical protein
VHDYHDELTGVLASFLAKRAPGYNGLGFPDPRKHLYTLHVSMIRRARTVFVSFELRYTGCEEGHDGNDDSPGGSGVPAA